MNNMTISIVLPTLGRTKEVDSMLNSILKYVKSTSIIFEVIVVDQNFSNALDSIIQKYKEHGIDIIHHKVSFRGLSKAKNYGAKLASGKYVCFIDDDAEFLEGTLERAVSRLDNGNFDIVSGRCVDREGKDSTLKFEHKEQVLSLSCFENRFIESTMFFKREICERFQYDENMGVGAFYGAEEGYDLVYRMLQENVRILFDPEIVFYHPQNYVSRSQPGLPRKVFSYRVGYGYLCKKHHLNKKYWKRLISVMLYIPYLAIVKPKDVKFYFGEMLGLLVGKYL
jgi:glycosyltransferase involved in cell wall biosynthesis